MHSDSFQKQVKDLLEQYQAAARANPQYPHLDDSPGGHLPRAVAALLVNRTDSLPYHYGTHKFWEMYKNEFRPYRTLPSFHAVKNAAEALRHISSKPLLDLEKHRQSLCRTYDIPAAPIPADKSHSADAFIV
jgi:hypothetical protein